MEGLHAVKQLAAILAALASADPLDLTLVTKSRSLLSFTMEMFKAATVGSQTTTFLYGNWSLSSADFISLRASLLRRFTELLSRPDSDASWWLRQWVQGCVAVHDSKVRSLVDDVVALLLSHGADPCASDAHGNSVVFDLVSSGRHNTLTKLLRSQKPWNLCSVHCGVFQRNRAGQTLREMIAASPLREQPVARLNVTLLQELEAFWTERIKPLLIEALTFDCGMAKDTTVLCVQYIDGSSGGVG